MEWHLNTWQSEPVAFNTVPVPAKNRCSLCRQDHGRTGSLCGNSLSGNVQSAQREVSPTGG